MAVNHHAGSGNQTQQILFTSEPSLQPFHLEGLLLHLAESAHGWLVKEIQESTICFSSVPGSQVHVSVLGFDVMLRI